MCEASEPQPLQRRNGACRALCPGAVLLREVDRRINLLPRLADCFEDHRNPNFIGHLVGELLAQRVYALALGYEDLNDHDELRRDPLAGKSTLNRLERTTDGADRYQKIRCDPEAVDRLLVDIFVEAHAEAPEKIILDIDATDTPLHGQQEGRFFHGYYGHYCTCRSTFSAASTCCARGSGWPIKTRRRAVSRS